MVKVPGGSTTISGHSAQSLKALPGRKGAASASNGGAANIASVIALQTATSIDIVRTI
jgi:hypothetical protein